MGLQKEPFAWAYLVEGESKLEELAVMFAPPVHDVIMVSSDEEGVNLPNDMAGK